MRKLIFLIFFLPAITALGHDIYVYSQERDKGFRLSDIGALWAKYDKESHDSWKISIKDMEKEIIELVPESLKNAQETSQNTNTPEDQNTEFGEAFSQKDSKDIDTSEELPPKAPETVQKPSMLQTTIATILEQTAVFFFGGIALLLYIVNLIFTKITAPKQGMAAVNKHKKSSGKNKKGAYQYNRK